MKRFFPREFATLPILVVAFALAGCGSKHERAKEAAPPLPTAHVRMHVVDSKSRPLIEEVTGTVRAKLRATMEARVSGRIEKLPVVLGGKVRQGELVARLDAGEISARLEQAEAALEEADRNWKRTSTLFEQQSATRAEYDAAQARLRSAKGAVTEARTMSGYVEIAAPFDGVVTKKWVDAGDVAAPGKPLVEIEDPTVLQLHAEVPEAIAAKITPGARLAIHADAANRDFTGLVSEIAPAADPASRTFLVKVDLPAAAGVSSGQFARVSVPIGESHSIRVPVTALVRRGQLEMVFSVTNQHARMHLVRAGRSAGDEIEILSGLDAGLKVVTNGAETLADGQPVEVK